MKKYILQIISLLISVITIISIIILNVLPNKYLALIIIIELFIIALGSILKSKKKTLKIIGIIILVLSILLNITGLYYINHTNNFLKNNFGKEIKNKSVYYLITNKENEKKLEELEEETKIFCYKYSKEIEKAKEILGLYTYEETEDLAQTLKNLNDYVLVDSINYNITEIDKNNYKILYEFNVETTEKRINKKQDAFNIYIGGRDFTDSLMDFNMILTVNKRTKTILLTSIPRDYYMDVVGYSKKDSLEFMGLLGEETIMNSLEKKFDTEIDYYGSIYTNGLVEVVDKLGGIEFCSDITFTTTHPKQTKEGIVGGRMTITKGCHHLNGVETLTAIRERKNIGSDRRRQENCRQVFLKLLEKTLSMTTLSNYEELLNSVGNLYKTNMNDKAVKSIIKSLINNKYTIIEQNVDGTDGENYIRQGTVKNYVMYPDEKTVEIAKQKIKETLEAR